MEFSEATVYVCECQVGPMTGIVDNISVVLYVCCRFSLTDGKDHVTSLRKLFIVDVRIFVFLSISFQVSGLLKQLSCKLNGQSVHSCRPFKFPHQIIHTDSYTFQLLLFQVFFFMLTGRLVIDWQLRRREVSEVVAVNGEKKQN